MENLSRRKLLLGGAMLLMTGQSSTKTVAAKDTPVVFDLDHERFMRMAIVQALKVPQCPFGSVIVNLHTKKIVGEGWVRTNKNPIWHGEMTAINSCADVDAGFKWSEVCLYTTGESCPMCQSAIIWTGMPLVVYGSSMPFLQKQNFGEINIRARTVVAASLKGKCQLIGGVLEKECNKLFEDARKMGE
jgi:tRNA(adenine34) deaminase